VQIHSIDGNATSDFQVVYMFNVLLIPVNDLISHPVETRFISIAKKMIEKYQVNFLVLRYKKIPTASELERKLDFKSIEFKDFAFGNMGLYYAMNSGPILLTLSKLLRKEKIDIIIHANVLPSTIAVQLGKIFHKPLIYDFQDYFPESAISYVKGGLLKSVTYGLTSCLTRFNIKYSDAIVTVTNAHKDKIREYDSNKLIKVIPNGVDTILFKPIPKYEALRKLGLEEFNDKTILIYFGSIDPWLDFSTVFKTMKRLGKKGFDIFLFLVGFCHSKYYVKEIKETADRIGVGERLKIFGPVPQDKLVYYVNASDVVLVPYKPLLKNQAVPLKILESIACNKSVCSTKLPEIISRFKDAVTFYSSEEELENALLKHIEGEAPMSSDKKKEILGKYSWDNIASSYYDLIAETVSNY